MSIATDVLTALSIIVLLEVAYLLGRRDKRNEQRARGFIEGWNAAVDAAGKAMQAGPTGRFAVTQSHREAQIRNAQDGWQ